MLSKMLVEHLLERHRSANPCKQSEPCRASPLQICNSPLEVHRPSYLDPMDIIGNDPIDALAFEAPPVRPHGPPQLPRIADDIVAARHKSEQVGLLSSVPPSPLHSSTFIKNVSAAILFDFLFALVRSRSAESRSTLSRSSRTSTGGVVCSS